MCNYRNCQIFGLFQLDFGTFLVKNWYSRRFESNCFIASFFRKLRIFPSQRDLCLVTLWQEEISFPRFVNNDGGEILSFRFQLCCVLQNKPCRGWAVSVLGMTCLRFGCANVPKKLQVLSTVKAELQRGACCGKTFEARCTMQNAWTANLKFVPCLIVSSFTSYCIAGIFWIWKMWKKEPKILSVCPVKQNSAKHNLFFPVYKMLRVSAYGRLYAKASTQTCTQKLHSYTLLRLGKHTPDKKDAKFFPFALSHEDYAKQDRGPKSSVLKRTGIVYRPCPRKRLRWMKNGGLPHPAFPLLGQIASATRPNGRSKLRYKDVCKCDIGT